MKIFLCLLMGVSIRAAHACPALLSIPREIHAEKTFNQLVDSIYRDLIVTRGAPGLVVGLSGTDSVLVFLAGVEAFARAGHPERMVGIHFAAELPKDLSDPVTRHAHWFELEIIPWLKTLAPNAKIIVDRSIDHRRDGLRWGALLEYSSVANLETGEVRLPDDMFWVLGTRNKTEATLLTYSNASTAVSAQPIEELYKSEVLQICAYLQTPKIALEQSCTADCTCGRDQLPAMHIPEVDALLMVRAKTLSPTYVEHAMPETLALQLNQYIEERIARGRFKLEIPYPGAGVFKSQSPTLDPNTLRNVQRTMEAESADPKQISEVLPALITSHNANLASDLMGSALSVSPRWMPEALMLFNVPGLRAPQLRQMLGKMFRVTDLNLAQVKRLSRINGKLGHYGFSFPAWRYLTQRSSKGQTLAEEFGFHRGTSGFWLEQGDFHVEYRREVIIVRRKGSEPIELRIRNSSYFYGRDKLPDAVTVAFNTDPYPWNKFLSFPDIASATEAIKRVESALNTLDRVNLEFNRWLKTDGRPALAAFLRERLGDKNKIYLGYIHGDQAPWFAQDTQQISPQVIDQLERGPRDLGDDARLTLFSGQFGDFP